MNVEENRMSPNEIAELMALKGWSQTRLAAELDLSQAAVQRWIGESRTPRGPASILMRMWLNKAREDRDALAKKMGRQRVEPAQAS